MFKESNLINFAPSEGPEEPKLPGYYVTDGNYAFAAGNSEDALMLASYVAGQVPTTGEEELDDFTDRNRENYNRFLDSDENVVLIDATEAKLRVYAVKGEISAKVRSLLNINFNSEGMQEDSLTIISKGERMRHKNHNIPTVIRTENLIKEVEKVISKCAERIDLERHGLSLSRDGQGCCSIRRTYSDGRGYTTMSVMCYPGVGTKMTIIYEGALGGRYSYTSYPGEDLLDILEHFEERERKEMPLLVS